MAAALPRHVESPDRPTVRVFDRVGEALLHVGTEAVVGGKFGNLGSSRRPLGLPLPVVRGTSTCRYA
jgi:hypothetical protein